MDTFSKRDLTHVCRTEKLSNNLADHLNSPQCHQERVRAARRDALLDIDASPRRRRVSNQNTREFRSINNGSSAIHDALGAEKRQLRDNRRAGDATSPDSPRRLRRSIRLSGVVSGETQPPEQYQNPDDPFLDTTVSSHDQIHLGHQMTDHRVSSRQTKEPTLFPLL